MDFITFLLINILRVYKFAILARVLLSWMPGIQKGPFVRFIEQVTEPLLRLFRSIIPTMGMIDLSPLAAFIVLDFLQIGLARLLLSI